MSVNGKNEKTAHLVWCAMIDLRLASQDGCVQSELRLASQDGCVQSEQQVNLFLVRWFTDAECLTGVPAFTYVTLLARMVCFRKGKGQ
ncbi:hypothetical protein PL51_22050 [Salmonella enterica]|uniref:Uncharacterized protein n=1 Tax=Salmonella enterica TaxID=28901 RepID=A0A5U2TZR2_SALER|nr:hypothetical protein [Salmonella enterica]EBP2041373.1 hypothetical protein [Salmonella enterica]EBP2047191.1 hypothetical protein [Salmonella enterica]EBP2074070.1 hypothetical protein [Salmonella enterica]EBP2082658.1 hypothetical protein [Salmonella enterica]